MGVTHPKYTSASNACEMAQPIGYITVIHIMYVGRFTDGAQ